MEKLEKLLMNSKIKDTTNNDTSSNKNIKKLKFH